MGTGTALRDDAPPPVKLAAVDEEKVSNIVEVCQVSRDEAVRVLDACRMDETMAIERFLSGNQVESWSQVSKKKKPPVRPASRSTYSAHPRAHDRDRDWDRRDRSDRPPYQADNSSVPPVQRRSSRTAQPHLQNFKEGASTLSKKRSPENGDGEGAYAPADQLSQTWGVQSVDDAWKDQGAATNAATNGDAWGLDAAATPPSDAWPNESQSGARAENPDRGWAEATSSTPTAKAWGVHDPAVDALKSQSESQGLEQGSSPISSSPRQDAAKKPPAVQSSTVKRTFNYAAAAAAGTSHAKPAPMTTDMSASAPISAAPPALPSEPDFIAPEKTVEDNLPSQDTSDPKKRRTRGGRKNRSRSEHERSPNNASRERTESTGNGLSSEVFESEGNGMSASPGDLHMEPPAPVPNAWATRAATAEANDDKRLESTPTAVAVASAAVVGNEPSTGDSLSLQFGSFGLSGLDSVNWSATEQKPADPVTTSMRSAEPNAVPSSPLTTASTNGPMKPSSIAKPTVAPASMPAPSGRESAIPVHPSQDMRMNPTASMPLPSASAGGSGSGIFPMLPVAPGGNFAPNYGAPYLMPQLHGYNPTLGSYENGADLVSSRAANLGPPGPLPLYDPAALSTMASSNGKYGGIPGLGDMATLSGVQSGMTKDSLHGSGELDKGNSGSTAGLPAGMDPLAAPYMMPGYPPSMQYPMYTYPNAPYGPPGMGPPGPSPFPFPPTGQVSSQGARGGFGFEDGSVGLGGNSRGGAGLGESMYTPGYLNASMAPSQKGPNDGSYKPVRGNSHPGNSLGAMGMASGLVHGMPYSDYQGIPGVSNGMGSNGGGPGGWNSRQPNGGRVDLGNGPGVASNQSMGGASQNSTLYAGAPGGAPGGYWTPQQGGYYP